MKKLIIVLICILTYVNAQKTINTSIKGRIGIYLVLEPDDFSNAKFFKEGDKAKFELFVKKENANGKPEGYYEVIDMEFMGYLEDVKRLRFKMTSEIDLKKVELNMPEIYIKMGEIGRIAVLNSESENKEEEGN